ncbi:MAG: hypothetical protein IT438_09780 [Phycisphaerales bacterium]|nr:hypothetical protein [Phycisphaerales bacterium]
MSSQFPGGFEPSTPSTPPSIPGELRAHGPRKAWPKVIGMLGGATQTMGPKGQPMDMPEVMKPTIVDVVMGLGGFLLAALLLIAGILLVMRKPVARPLHILHAVLAVVSTVVSVGYTVMKMQAMSQWAAQNPDHEFAKMLGMVMVFIYIAIGIGVLFGLAYPAFTLVWFTMIKRDAGEIRQGLDQEPAF